jgi:hypothetical protein
VRRTLQEDLDDGFVLEPQRLRQQLRSVLHDVRALLDEIFENDGTACASLSRYCKGGTNSCGEYRIRYNSIILIFVRPILAVNDEFETKRERERTIY